MSSPRAREFVPRLHPVADSALARVALAAELHEAGCDEQARIELDAALRDNPELAEAYRLKAAVLDHQGDHAAAIHCLETALEIDPSFTGAWVGLAQSRAYRSELALAAEAAERALDLDARCEPALVVQASILSRLGRLDEARATYRRILELDPGSAAAHYELARLLAEAGDAEQALQCAQSARRLNPLHFDTNLLLGDLLYEAGDRGAALEIYRAASRVAPQRSEPRVRMARVLVAQDRKATAVAMLRAALALRPPEAEPYLMMADLQCELGRQEEAERLYAMAFERGAERRSLEYPGRLGEIGMEQVLECGCQFFEDGRIALCKTCEAATDATGELDTIERGHQPRDDPDHAVVDPLRQSAGRTGRTVGATERDPHIRPTQAFRTGIKGSVERIQHSAQNSWTGVRSLASSGGAITLFRGMLRLARRMHKGLN